MGWGFFLTLTNFGFLGSDSTKLSELQHKKIYENSTFIQSKSFVLTRARHKRECSSHSRGRNGVRGGEAIKPVIGEIGQQKRDQ
jgi:hypothetical protein